MALPQYRDEVLITLTTINPPESFPFPDRRFFLTKDKPSIVVGRTSKRNSSYEAAKHNAWFDSPVMSRDHARLSLDTEGKKVFITDIGSLHGTFQNENRLTNHRSSPMKNGDCIQFGVPIERNLDTYAPCTMRAQVRFGTDDPQGRSRTFTVPDDDSEDNDVDGSIHNSSKILRSTEMKPISSWPSRKLPSIDLTSRDFHPITNSREDEMSVTDHHSLPSVSSIMQSSQKVSYVDLSSPSPQATVPCGFSPIDTYQNCVEREGGEDMDIDLSDNSSDMETEVIPPQWQSSYANSSSSRASSCSRGSTNEHDQSDYEAQSDMDEEGEEEDDEEDDANTDADTDADADGDEEKDEFEEPDEFGDDIRDYPTSINKLDRSITENQYTSMSIAEGVDKSHQPVISRDTASDAAETAKPVATVDAAKDLGIAIETSSPADDLFFAVPNSADYLSRCQSNPLMKPHLPTWVPPIIPPQILSKRPVFQPSMVDGSSVSNTLTTSAEFMGEKTGKYEFFEAREQNRLRLAHPDPHTVTTLPTAPTEPKAVNEEATPINQNTSEISGAPAKPVASTEATTEDGIHTTFWATSGMQFLNCPPAEVEEPTQVETPALDETSAFQFELSKNAINRNSDTAPAESLIVSEKEATGDVTEPAGDEDAKEVVEKSKTSPGSKRKASEISALTTAEECIEACTEAAEQTEKAQKRLRSVAAQKRFRQALLAKKAQQPSPGAQTSHVVDGSSDRPAKRLRRVAEVIGFAALGGVAVMSALIATAPTL